MHRLAALSDGCAAAARSTASSRDLLVGAARASDLGGGGAGRFEIVAASIAPPVAAVAIRAASTRRSPVSSPRRDGARVRRLGRHADLRKSIAWFCALYAPDGLDAVAPVRRGCGVRLREQRCGRAGPVASHAEERSIRGRARSSVMLLVRRVLGDRERRLQLAERERDVAAREAVVEERARIARELHDAIAHNVSMMVVQAGAERRVLEPSNGSTRDVLETIEKIGRGALTEMRRLVGMLRSDDARAARAAAEPRRPGDARRAGARGRAAGRVARGRRAAHAAGRHRAVGVPDRAGGADERAQARRRRARHRPRPLRRRIARARDRRRRRAAPPRRVAAAATGWSGCASASPSTAAASTPAAAPAAASQSACCCRSDDDAS